MSSKCFMANVTYDNNGRITKVVPISQVKETATKPVSTATHTATNETKPTTLAISAGSILSNPLSIGLIGLLLYLFLGSKKNANS